jgi:hypothetical protein
MPWPALYLNILDYFYLPWFKHHESFEGSQGHLTKEDAQQHQQLHIMGHTYTCYTSKKEVFGGRWEVRHYSYTSAQTWRTQRSYWPGTCKCCAASVLLTTKVDKPFSQALPVTIIGYNTQSKAYWVYYVVMRRYTSRNVRFNESIFGLATCYKLDLVSDLDTLLPLTPTTSVTLQIAPSTTDAAPETATTPMTGPSTSIEAGPPPKVNLIILLQSRPLHLAHPISHSLL